MAKHRMLKKRRARKAALAGVRRAGAQRLGGLVAAAGISTALVLGHATNITAANFMVQLSNTVIGAGGQGDTMSARVPDKLTKEVVPHDYDYYGVEYPATINLQDSREAGLPVMHEAIKERSTEQYLIVAGYSEGTLIAEEERRNLQAMDPKVAPSRTQLSFLQIASPFAGNGGLYGRFPGFFIPGITDAMGVGQPTRYDTTYVAREYDMYVDFPAYFNPLAIANSFLAIRYGHPDAFYDPLLSGTSPAYVTTVHNTAQGSTDTYALYYAMHLPLLGPVRELAGLTYLTPLTEPVLSAVEPLLRLVIDMGYTDRVNADPATPRPFSLITPPPKILEALAGLPGALAQGASNLFNGGQTATTLPDPHGTLVPAPSLPVPLRAPEVQSSQARLAIVPDPEPEFQPVAKIDDTPPKSSERHTATPTPTPTVTPTKTSTSTKTSETPGDRLHPTVTSDGNKVTPGGTTTDGSPTGSGTATGTSTATTTTTDITTTGTTTTTTTTGTSGTTADESTDHESPASNAA